MKRAVAVSFLAVTLAGLLLAQQPAAKGAAQEKQSSPTKPATKKPRQRVVTNLAGFDLLEADKTKQTTVVGATRGGKPPVALAPRLGKVYDAALTFHWSHEGRPTRFTFVLRDEARQQVHRGETQALAYTLPDGVALEPGKTYLWSVEPAGGFLAGGPSAPTGILVLAGKERGQLEQALSRIGAPNSYEDELARARLFTEHRLWYDAIAAYSDLIARYPDRRELFEERGMIYAQLDVTRPLADADFAQADSLPMRD